MMTCVAVAIAVYSGAIVFSRSDHQPNPVKEQPDGAYVPSTQFTPIAVCDSSDARAPFKSCIKHSFLSLRVFV